VINAAKWRITALTIVAEKCAHVMVVDIHARTHTYATVSNTSGARAGCEASPVTSAGMKGLIAWILRGSSGQVLASAEGTSCHGASPTRTLTAEGITVGMAQNASWPAQAAWTP